MLTGFLIYVEKLGSGPLVSPTQLGRKTTLKTFEKKKVKWKKILKEVFFKPG